eukprot:TRINITY_DN4535_c0_g1_i1.p1 TRINITY_DN4535_c0_g1~~TRINITY_DN4535_c0_g1_i1.p1  ORF type:complete len:259 (-),score=50.09 TRINITY_DN4535_c0_g1_i1:10-786(-)
MSRIPQRKMEERESKRPRHGDRPSSPSRRTHGREERRQRTVEELIAELSQRFRDEDGLEVEIKFGSIVEKESGKRMNKEGTQMQLIGREEYKKLRFISGISEEHYAFYKRHLSQEEEKGLSIVQDQDDCYADHSRLNREEGKDPILVSKLRLHDYNIHVPGSPYDLKISLCKEKRLPIPQTFPELVMTRKKERTSFSSQDYEIDLTKATMKSFPEGNEWTNYELEIEIKDPASRETTNTPAGHLLLSRMAIKGENSTI